MSEQIKDEQKQDEGKKVEEKKPFDPKITFRKYFETLAMTLITAVVSFLGTKLTETFGVEMSAEFQAELIATGVVVMTGGLNMLRNWWKQRKKKEDKE